MKGKVLQPALHVRDKGDDSDKKLVGVYLGDGEKENRKVVDLLRDLPEEYCIEVYPTKGAVFYEEDWPYSRPTLFAGEGRDVSGPFCGIGEIRNYVDYHKID